MYFINQSRPCADEPFTHPVQRLDILLVDVFGRHKAHGRPRHGFRDNLGVTHIILVRLDKGLDELGCQELDVVPMLAEAPGPVMRPAAGFDTDAYRGQLRHKGHQVMPR